MKILNDYKCHNCHTIEERLASLDDITYCSKCNHSMERLLSSPGMVKTNFADKTGFKHKN